MLTTIADLVHNSHVLSELGAGSLSKMYGEYMKAPYQAPRAQGIHASEVVKCVRKAYHSLVGTHPIPPPNAPMYMRFNMGSALHEMAQRNFRYICNKSKSPRIVFESEVPTAPTPLGEKYNITSHCDGVFTIYDAKGAPFVRIGLEIKTESTAQYAKLTEPKEEHLDQATIYMAALDLPIMWFFYMNKDSGEYTPMISPWLVAFDQARWEKLEKRIETVLEHEAFGILPPAEAEGTFVCQFCPYKYLCDAKTQPTFDEGG